jgi:hypothetical protein
MGERQLLNSSGYAPIQGDVNQDGIVDIFDLVKLGRNFGKGEGK